MLRAGLWTGAVVLAAAIFMLAWVGIRAFTAKNALEDAQAQLTAFRSVVGTSEGSTAALYDDLQAKTTAAAQAVDDPIWSFAEAAPVLGDDLSAFRQLAQLIDRFVKDGVGPVAIAADGLSVDSLKPTDGRIDISPLQDLAPAVSELESAMGAAAASTAAIDTSGTVEPITGVVNQLSGMLTEFQPMVQEMNTVLPYLYPALGGEEPRHYLLMFQNNAEERASGGNPASMVLLEVDNGAIELKEQASSGDFDWPYAEEPRTFDGDWGRLFGPRASTYVTNITFTPDFPTTAKLAQRMWELERGRVVDGVISFDPVALSYLLKATGPITLATGETLTHETAVPFLLNEVYSRYIDPKVQDAVFASAAATIFKAVTSGQGDPKDYLEQLQPMIEEQRLKMWSAREDEEELLLSYPVGNMLPADNSEATTLGVYNNDSATSKMSYYMDATIGLKANRCTPGEPKFRVSTTVTNTLDYETALGLPAYILANQDRIDFGGDRQWVLLYGPVGSKLAGAEIEGEPVVFGDNIAHDLNTVPSATGVDDLRPAVSGTMHGRPVAIVSIKMGPQESRTVEAVFTGGENATTPLSVSHTPKVRPTPVEIAEKACG